MRRSQEDEERFTNTVQMLSMLCSVLPPAADVAFVRDELVKCDSVGHILDPTAYRNGMDDREALGEFIAKALPFARAAEAFKAKAEELAARRAGAAS